MLILSNLTGQIDFTNKLYTKILFEDIELKNSEKDTLTDEDIFKMFYHVDTLLGSFGEQKDEYIENLYVNDGLLKVMTENEIDTIKNWNNETIVDFIVLLRDDSGNEIRKEKLFSLNQEYINELNFPISYDFTKNDEKLLTKEGEYWKVIKIKNEKKEIYLDECHDKYMLKFDDKKTFVQCYRDSIRCQTSIDTERIKEDGFFMYFENEVFHSIVFNKGKWKTHQNKLLLSNKQENWVKIIPYQIIDKLLVLEPKPKYLITLERNPTSNK